MTAISQPIKKLFRDTSQNWRTDTIHAAVQRVFKSTARGKVNVYGGNYGYLINQKSEVKQLTKDLKSGKDVTREPVYAQKGAGRNGNDDISDTYVEVDLTKQHMWYYKKTAGLL